MIEINKKNIPPEMAELPQFVLWRFETRKKSDKKTKMPYCAKTKSKASSTDPKFWCSLDEAIEALEASQEDSVPFDGIGFVFTKEDGLVGVDLDHCVDKNLVLNDFAKEVVNKLYSYTELSPSGTGLHVIVKGELDGKGINKEEIEIYDSGRFFTVTGNSLQTVPREVDHGGSILEEFYTRFSAIEDDIEIGLSTGKTPVRVEQSNVPATATALDVPELLKIFCNDELGVRLWTKDRYYKSHSEYDLAIANNAVARGFTTEEIAWIIHSHRSKYGSSPEKAFRPGYVVELISKAEKGLAEVRGKPEDELYREHAEQFKEEGLFVTMGHIMRNPKPLEWLVEGYLPTTGIIWVAGKWSTKKTFLMIDICAHIVNGVPWCGNDVKKTGVVYLTGEGYNGMGKRSKGIELAKDLNMGGEDFLVTRVPVLINKAIELQYFIEQLRDQQGEIGLIVIDTKSANMLGSDSDAGLMNDWINTVRKLEQHFQCTIVIVDHIGHGVDNRPRGASQQMGAADAVYMVECDPDIDTMMIKLTTEKDPKDFTKPKDQSFRAHMVDLPMIYAEKKNETPTSLFLEPIITVDMEVDFDSTLDTAGLGKHAKKALGILADMIGEYTETVEASKAAGTSARVGVSDWTDRCMKDKELKMFMEPIREALLMRELVVIDGYYIRMGGVTNEANV